MVTAIERECVQRLVYVLVMVQRCKGKILELASWLSGGCKATGRSGY